MLRDENKTKFKVGQKVRLKEDCSGIRAGEICTLVLDKEDNDIYAVNGHYDRCSCVSNWKEINNDKESDYKFKVGAEVRCKNIKCNDSGFRAGMEFVITRIDYYVDYYCCFGGLNGDGVYDKNLELVEKKEDVQKKKYSVGVSDPIDTRSFTYSNVGMTGFVCADKLNDLILNNAIDNLRLSTRPMLQVEYKPRLEFKDKFDDDGVNTSIWKIASEYWPYSFNNIKNKPMNIKETIKNDVLKLTKEVEKILSRMGGEYRDLYRAGFLNGDLIETEKYDEVMMEILREEYRAKVVE